MTENNLSVFRDCLSEPVIRKLAIRPPRVSKRKLKAKSNSPTPSLEDTPVSQDETIDANDLSEFIEYLASEVFGGLPEELRTLSYAVIQEDKSLGEKYTDPLPKDLLTALLEVLPVSITDSLVTYSLIEDPTSLHIFLGPVLSAYIAAVTEPPPPWASTRASACEICERDWINLTYHHLIPRSTHSKVLRKGWHAEYMLNSVAWLCRACHNFVHSCASNEELAKEWYTVEKLRERDDVQKWAKWASTVRWKKR
ncbi:hypothetical protein DL96DRAFT_1592375 [Flagelloscypha sp. PMI_526]|nr:hypothetical protein DL96DRAFT_1592375 [Flagelloscypha sp. PMI_526]